VRDWGRLGAREPRWQRSWTDVKQMVVDRGEQLTHEQIKILLTTAYGSLTRAFVELDFFKDGVLSLVELQEGLYQVLTKSKNKEFAKYRMLCEVRADFNARVEKIFRQMDVSGNGKVTYEEFARTRLQPMESQRQFTARRNSELQSVAAGSDVPEWRVMNTSQMERSSMSPWALSPKGSPKGSPKDSRVTSPTTSPSRRRSGDPFRMVEAPMLQSAQGSASPVQVQKVEAPVLQSAQRSAPPVQLEKLTVASIPRVLGDDSLTPRADLALGRALPDLQEHLPMVVGGPDACRLVVRNADYQRLRANPVLIPVFEAALKVAICKEAGRDMITPECITMSLSPGSIVADYLISMSHLSEAAQSKIYNKLRCSSTLAHTCVMALTRVKGIEAICTGRLEVCDFGFPATSALQRDSLISLDAEGNEPKLIEGSDDFRAFATMLLQKFPSVEEAFASIDLSGEGVLSMNEFEVGVKALRWGGDSRAVFKEMDLDKNGTLSVKEFSRLMLLPPADEAQVDKFRVKTNKDVMAERTRRSKIPGALLYHRGTCLASCDMIRPQGEHVATSAGFHSFERSPTGRLDDQLHPNFYPGQDPEVFSDKRGPGYCSNGPEKFAEVAQAAHPTRGSGWKVGSCTGRTERFGPMIPSAQGRLDRELSAASFASYEGQAPRDTWAVSGVGSHSMALHQLKMGPKESWARPLAQRSPWRQEKMGRSNRTAPLLAVDLEAARHAPAPWRQQA
jgi:Ca2+-binding EF-hand superfamily protein